MVDQWMFVTKLPDVQLCHTTLNIGKSKQQFYNQGRKCRQLICSCKEVIASPSPEDIDVINAVMPVSFYKTRLIEVCKKLNLKPLNASMAKNSMIERCAAYTIKFKLMSRWVQAGKFIINNPKFLSAHGKMSAVSKFIDADINVSNGEIIIHLKPCLVRLPPPQLENYGICTEALQKFKEDQNFKIEDCYINLSWCHILPSMKRAQIVKISRNLNMNGNETLFKNYESIGQYWKNQYGYILDADEEDAVYCSVYIKPLGPNLFTYPFTCVRNNKIQKFPRCDGHEIVKTFMSNLNESCNQVCGIELEFFSQSYLTSTCPARYIQNKIKFSNDRCDDKMYKNNEEKPQVVPANKLHFQACKHVENDAQRVPSTDVIPPTQFSNNEYCTGSDKNVLKSTSIDKKLLSKFPLSSSGKFIPIFNRGNCISTSKQSDKRRDRVGSRVDSTKKLSGQSQYQQSGECHAGRVGSSKLFDDLFSSASSNKQTSRKRKVAICPNLLSTKQTKTATVKANASRFDSLFKKAGQN